MFVSLTLLIRPGTSSECLLCLVLGLVDMDGGCLMEEGRRRVERTSGKGTRTKMETRSETEVETSEPRMEVRLWTLMTLTLGVANEKFVHEPTDRKKVFLALAPLYLWPAIATPSREKGADDHKSNSKKLKSSSTTHLSIFLPFSLFLLTIRTNRLGRSLPHRQSLL